MPEILPSLSDQLRRKVLAACEALSFGPGRTIIEEGSQNKDLYFLQKGQLLVRALSPAGVEVAFRVMEAGDCIGEFAAIDGLPRSASVESITPVSLACLPRARFMELVRSEPEFAWAVTELITRRARAMSAPNTSAEKHVFFLSASAIIALSFFERAPLSLSYNDKLK